MRARRIVTPVLVVVVVVGILACQLPSLGPAGPTPGADAEKEFVAYITSEFIAVEAPHYVTWVPPASGSGPLPTTTALGAWKCEGGVCMEVPLEEPAQKMKAETGRPWQYSYYVFAIVSLSADGTRATIHLDQTSGPLAGLGEEIVLVKKGGKWVEEGERKMLWIS